MSGGTIINLDVGAHTCTRAVWEHDACARVSYITCEHVSVSVGVAVKGVTACWTVYPHLRSKTPSLRRRKKKPPPSGSPGPKVNLGIMYTPVDIFRPSCCNQISSKMSKTNPYLCRGGASKARPPGFTFPTCAKSTREQLVDWNKRGYLFVTLTGLNVMWLSVKPHGETRYTEGTWGSEGLFIGVCCNAYQEKTTLRKPRVILY